jgi:hypothetical protein
MAATYGYKDDAGVFNPIDKDYSLDPRFTSLSKEDQDIINKQQLQGQYGGMGEAALSDFQKLLGRLETSKIRQQQAKDISARPNIYAQGLAQMMQNF